VQLRCQIDRSLTMNNASIISMHECSRGAVQLFRRCWKLVEARMLEEDEG
jgi:hypothetical protein